MANQETSKRNYQVALSFAGEDRAVADRLAGLMQARGITVFYDEYEKARLWGEDLYEHLADIYANQAEFCLILISRHYLAKAWTQHERQSAQARAFQDKRPYILPLRLDDTEVPGIPHTVGYLDLRKTSPNEVVDMIESKLKAVDMRDAPTHEETRVRSLGIPLPKRPRALTQLEKDRLLRKTFYEVKQYFQQALAQLETAYPEIQTDFIEVHNLKFACKVYVQGEFKTACKIWLGTPFVKSEAICYSAGRIDLDRDNSFNDYVTIDDLGGTTSFTHQRRSSRDQDHINEDFDPSEVAQHFWQRFTSALEH